MNNIATMWIVSIWLERYFHTLGTVHWLVLLSVWCIRCVLWASIDLTRQMTRHNTMSCWSVCCIERMEFHYQTLRNATERCGWEKKSVRKEKRHMLNSNNMSMKYWFRPWNRKSMQLNIVELNYWVCCMSAQCSGCVGGTGATVMFFWPFARYLQHMAQYFWTR